jgi:hypothetical protein
MKYLLFVFFQFAVFCACSQEIEHLLARAVPVPEKKREKEKEKQQREEIILPVDIDIPAGKTQKETDEENALLMSQKWEKYLSERIAEMQQLLSQISQLDSNAITKECLDDYQIEVNNLKEKVDFKLGNDPLWKENDELDEMRALFFETHTHTVKKLKYWEERMTPKETTNKWILIGTILLAIMALVPIFTQIKAAISVKNTKKEAKKMVQQQQQEAEKQMLLADEDNIINIK